MGLARELINLVESLGYFEEPKEVLKLISREFKIPYKWTMMYEKGEGLPQWVNVVSKGEDEDFFFAYTPYTNTLTIQVPTGFERNIEAVLKKAKWVKKYDGYQNSPWSYKFEVKVRA